MRRAPQAHQLHITRNRHAHVGGELPMEVKRREMRHLAQGLQRKVTLQVAIDVSEHGIEAFGIGSRNIRHRAGLPGYAVDDRITRSTVDVPSRACSGQARGGPPPLPIGCDCPSTRQRQP